MRLAIITTHPIQYYAPVFRLLHQRGRLQIRVFYTWGQAAENKPDPGFGKHIQWDIPLLEGYPYTLLQNTAANLGSHHFKGITNPDIIRQIKGYTPDALLLFGWAYQSHLKVLRYFTGKIPVYFRGDSTLLDDAGGIKSLIRRLFLNWVYSHVNHAFYVGTNNKAYFKKYGLREEQLSYAPHAIDNDRFAAAVTYPALSRSRLGIRDEDVVILFSGKLESKKDPQALLQAFLKIEFAGSHLIFAGDGPLRPHLQALAKNNTNVHFLGFCNQSEMPAVYQLCDLFCLPSKGPGETWGLAVNEAMACGKAVLLSDKVGCAADLVRPQNGSIFKNGDLDGLVSKLKELIADKQKLQTMGRNAAVLIKPFKFETLATAIENTLLLCNRT